MGQLVIMSEWVEEISKEKGKIYKEPNRYFNTKV